MGPASLQTFTALSAGACRCSSFVNARTRMRRCICVANIIEPAGACKERGRDERGGDGGGGERGEETSNKHVVERDCFAHIGLYCIRCLAVRERSTQGDGEGINTNYSYFRRDYKAVK